MSASHRSKPGRRVRRAPLVWCAGAIAAGLLTLSTNGTLSAWTSAILNNSNNQVATTTAVILREVGPDGTAAHTSQTCLSSSGVGNSFTCTNIDKYGGTSSPLVPGGTQQTDVTFTNLGGANATSFVFTPGTCTQTPTAGTGTPPAGDVCGGGDLSVALSCSDGATYAAGSAWTDLAQTAIKPTSLTTKTHTATLAPSGQWTCRVTVALSASASVLDQNVTVTQPLSWTLNK